LNLREKNKIEQDYLTGIMRIFENNSHKIQEQLGGKRTQQSIRFRREIEQFKVM